MQKKVRWLTNERQDLPDVQNLINFAEQEFDSVGKYFFCGGSAYIVRGFEINIVSGLNINCTVGVLVSFGPDGRMNRWLATDPQLTATVADNATNYVEAQIYAETSNNATRVFWDPTALGGVGQEFTQSIDTVTTQKVRLVVNQTGFTGDADKTPIGIVVAAGAVIQRVHDNYKNTVYSGSPTNPTFVENLFFRLSDTDNDGYQNRWNFGSPRTDTTITNLRNSISAIQSQIADMIGDSRSTASVAHNNWFDARPTDLFASNQDRNVKLTEGGTLTWNNVTGQFSFTADFKLRLVGGYTNTIQASASSPITINAANKCAYVTLQRGTTTNVTVAVADIASIPADKDTFIIAIRGTDGRLYMAEGTAYSNADSRVLGSAGTSPIVTVVDGTTYTDGNFKVTDYASAPACIQAAFDSIKTIGGILYIRAGTYMFNSAGSTVTTSGQTKHVEIIGDGDATVLQQQHSYSLFTLQSSDITFKRLYFKGGDKNNDVVYGDFSTAAFGGIVFDECHFADPIGSAISRVRFLLNFQMGLVTGSGRLQHCKITRCKFELNNSQSVSSSGGLNFVGAVEVIHITENWFSGTARRFLAFDVDAVSGAANWAGSHINIHHNNFDSGTASLNQYGISIYGWREFVNICDNQLTMRAGGGFQCSCILVDTYPFASDPSMWLVVNGNNCYCSSTQFGTRTIYIHGNTTGSHYIYGVTVTGNHCEMATVGAQYNISLDRCVRFTLDGNTCQGAASIDDIDTSTCSYGVVGINHLQRYPSSYADPATSFNVQSQIVKFWACLVPQSAGAVNIFSGYNIPSASYSGTNLTINFSRANVHSYYGMGWLPLTASLQGVYSNGGGSSMGLIRFYPNGSGGYTIVNWASGISFMVIGTDNSVDA